MRIFKNKVFSKWAAKEGLQDHALSSAVNEMQNGLVDADLGGNVFKKRVALGSQGKSGGVRTLLAYKVDDKAFFIYGFAKNNRSNIKLDELRALKVYGRILMGYNNDDINQAIKAGALIEVQYGQ